MNTNEFSSCCYNCMYHDNDGTCALKEVITSNEDWCPDWQDEEHE